MRTKLHRVADALFALGCDERGPAAVEWIADDDARIEVITDGTGHAFDGLLGAVAGALVRGVARAASWIHTGNVPDSALGTVAAPSAFASLFDRIPAGLVLPVIVAAA